MKSWYSINQFMAIAVALVLLGIMPAKAEDVTGRIGVVVHVDGLDTDNQY